MISQLTEKRFSFRTTVSPDQKDGQQAAEIHILPGGITDIVQHFNRLISELVMAEQFDQPRGLLAEGISDFPVVISRNSRSAFPVPTFGSSNPSSPAS